MSYCDVCKYTHVCSANHDSWSKKCKVNQEWLHITDDAQAADIHANNIAQSYEIDAKFTFAAICKLHQITLDDIKALLLMKAKACYYVIIKHDNASIAQINLTDNATKIAWFVSDGYFLTKKGYHVWALQSNKLKHWIPLSLIAFNKKDAEKLKKYAQQLIDDSILKRNAK